MAESIPVTKEGFEVLKRELEHLKSHERPKIIREIAEARGHGDLSENGEYHAAREKQGFIEARIGDLDDKLSRAMVIDVASQDCDVVRFGASVTVTDENTGEQKTFKIVGDLEADIHQNKISLSSPFAKALLGKGVDDVVKFKAPKGESEYVINAIEYA